MRQTLALLLVLAATLGCLPAHADGFDADQRRQIVGILRDALRTDPTILRDAIAALQADDAHQQDQATSAALARLGPQLVQPSDPVEGNPLGDVTVVEFYDPRCPYCKAMLPVMADLLRADPKVRLVMKDLPILGPASELESRFLLAAQRQGAYFKLQPAIMQASGTPTRDSLRYMADNLGLDGNRMLRDIDDPTIKARLAANADLAHQLGIEGTPALIIGTHLFAGATDLKELQAAIADQRRR